MKHRITHELPWLRTGVNLRVRLHFEPHEETLIRNNNMERVIIVEREPTTDIVEDKDGKKQKVVVDNNIYFREFYGRRTSWHVDSVLKPKISTPNFLKASSASSNI